MASARPLRPDTTASSHDLDGKSQWRWIPVGVTGFHMFLQSVYGRVSGDRLNACPGEPELLFPG